MLFVVRFYFPPVAKVHPPLSPPGCAGTFGTFFVSLQCLHRQGSAEA